MTTMKTRFLGKCGVCEGDFKLHQGKLVHHGYQRPGDGMIHGDCFAVGYEPHETSPAASEKYKAIVESMLVDAEKALARLQSGEVTELTKIKQSGYGRNQTQELVKVTKAESPYEFESMLKSAIWQKESAIRHIKADIERMVVLLTDWKAQPVRTFDEEMEKKAAGVAERKAAKEEVRQAKIAKKVAFYQKRIDSAFSKKKADSLRDLFDSVLRASSDLKLTRQEMLDLVDRKQVWDFFGLVCPASWNDPVNHEALEKMWKTGYWPQG